MTTLNSGRIGGQNEAYRKGLVLGLTMAEVGILIIFVLLLLLVLGEKRRQLFLGMQPIAPVELARLQAREQTLRQVANELGVEVEDSTENFTRLVRVVREAVNQSNAKSALTAAKQTLDDIKRARAQIQNILQLSQTDGAKSVANEVERQGFQLANQEGQINILQKKLVATGQGKGERPCWVQLDGTIDFLYDVVLTSSGIKMREYKHVHRQRERALLPAAEVHPHEVLTENVFLARTRPLFQRSQENNCRFFVVIYDATGSNEKLLYKSLLKAVEGHFYKRLDYGSAPF